MTLATSKTDIVADIQKFIWLLYGPPKIGKSTFASDMENAYFLSTEHGHRHLSIYNRQIKDWEDFKLAVKELRSVHARKFYPIVIDTVSILWKMCQDFVCNELGIDHPQDEDWGKGWEAVKDEFMEQMIALSALNKGVVFICHHKEKEVKGRGITYTKFVPRLSSGCWDVIGPFVDIIAYCGFDEKDPRKRVLVTEPREDLEAGFRSPRALKNPLPPVLPLSYQVVKDAWEDRHNRSTPTKKIKRIIKKRSA